MNDPGGFPLFGYGTFRDPRWRREILGAEDDSLLASIPRADVERSIVAFANARRYSTVSRLSAYRPAASV